MKIVAACLTGWFAIMEVDLEEISKKTVSHFWDAVSFVQRSFFK